MQRAEKSIRIAAPVEQVYNYWHDFSNLPTFMEHVKEVTHLGGNVWHWKLKGPLNTTFEYDARITEEQPNKSIGWNSEGESVHTTGVVTFLDLQDNTEVHVIMQWSHLPGGAMGEKLSGMLQNPEAMLEEDLRRLKDVLERRLHENVHGSPVYPANRLQT
ncbi:MAG: SRPBCC family protein [Chloroflexi bacterium]|nr:SRPBCC family protein [Chloroflexota bacterium]